MALPLSRARPGMREHDGRERAERFVGVVDTDSIVWVFFGGNVMAPPFTAERVQTEAKAAFDVWGGAERLKKCVTATAS